MNELQQLMPIIISVLAAGGSAYTWFSGRGKRRADEAQVLTGTALELVQTLEKRVTSLAKEIKEVEIDLEREKRLRASLEKRVNQLEAENAQLRKENHNLQIQLSNRKRGL